MISWVLRLGTEHNYSLQGATCNLISRLLASDVSEDHDNLIKNASLKTSGNVKYALNLSETRFGTREWRRHILKYLIKVQQEPNS